MDIDVFPADELPRALRALRTALAPEGAPGPRERAFLDTYARITRYTGSLDALPAIAPGEVRIADPHRRKRLVQLAGLAVLLAQPVRPAAVAWLRALSKALATADGVVAVCEALRDGRRRRAVLLARQRGFRAIFKEAYRAEGTMGVLRFVAAMALGTAVNKDKLWRYKRLGLLPEGTLGRTYFAHMVRTGFPFPGEPAGIPDTVAYHDILHVLAEHATTPLGEIQQGSFQGGNRREDGFFFIQFVVLQFHHALRITRTAPPVTGSFDPALVLWAIHRGAQCPQDLTHQWDFWPLMELPLAEARRRIGLIAKLPAATRTAA